jgi:glycerophosphoryl diester phosphodiesterase
MKTPAVWAHRGAPLGRGTLPPENSLAAFQRAVDSGADAIEFDLHLTRDEHFVVHHDLLLDHPRLGLKAIPDLNLEELKEVALDESGERIPTLQQVVELLQGTSHPFIPELKTPDQARARGLEPVPLLCREIERLEIQDRVVVQCFNAATLDQLRSLNPSLHLLALYRHDQQVRLDQVPGQAEYLGLPMLPVFFFGRELVARAYEQGRKVVPWRDMALSENKEVFDRLAEFGVEAVMVDDADQALIHFGRRTAPPDFQAIERSLLYGEAPTDSRRCRKPAHRGDQT